MPFNHLILCHPLLLLGMLLGYHSLYIEKWSRRRDKTDLNDKSVTNSKAIGPEAESAVQRDWRKWTPRSGEMNI